MKSKSLSKLLLLPILVLSMGTFTSCSTKTSTPVQLATNTATPYPATTSSPTPRPSSTATGTAIPTETLQPLVDHSPKATILTPTITALPSPTSTAFPDYSIIPPLENLIITKQDKCFSNYGFPIISQYGDAREIDLTPSTDPKYCMLDCARRRWIASDGARFTFTVARVASPSAAKTLLEEEYNKVEQLYSDRDKYSGISWDDPYLGQGDDSWAGNPVPGLTGYSAVARSSVVVIMEWTQVPQGLDLEFDFGATNEFARFQFGKIDNVLSTPFPSKNDQSTICTP